MNIEFDELQMYFGEPYVIDCESAVGSITIYEPSIGDIIKVGQSKFFSTLNVFITNPTANRLFLWEAGVDWNDLSDFQLFCSLYNGIDNEVSKLLFGDLDWSTFKLYNKEIEDQKTSEVVLASVEHHLEINEEVYEYIHQYLQKMFNMKPETELTDDKLLKEWWIRKDTINLQQKIKKGQKEEHSLKSMVSACVNHPGFKYKKNELREVGVCEFYDSVQRLQIYEQTTACMKGLYSGFVDGSKIKPEAYNFMKNI